MIDNTIQESSSKPLHHIFTDIPEHYDLINHIITLGMDNSWRQKAALACLLSHPARILDLCCGTGDLTISLARLAQYLPEITGVDFSQPMLEMAKRKAALSAKSGNIRFIQADVSLLPFPNGYFDCVSISFAFRNLTYKNPMALNYLGEILRVLKPGGEFIIIESSQPRSAFIRYFHHLYLRWFVFPAGFIISRNKSAYRYLTESAARFFSAEEAQQFLIKAGFRHASQQRLFLGAVAIYTAIR